MFERFIRILIAQENSEIIDDIHVMPFWKRCDTCNLDYRFIGKMETFSQDAKFIMEKVGINDPKIVLEDKVHAGSRKQTDEMAKKLFTHLPNEMIEKLYDLYKIDFEMFDYEYKQYIS